MVWKVGGAVVVSRCSVRGAGSPSLLAVSSVGKLGIKSTRSISEAEEREGEAEMMGAEMMVEITMGG